MQTNRSGSSRVGGVGTTLSLLLLGTLLIAAATMFCYQQLKPTIEQDLTSEVTSALQGTNVSGIVVEGQDVFLSGDVSSAVESDNAFKAAAAVYGVRHVVNNLTVNGITEDKTTTTDAGTAVAETDEAKTDMSNEAQNQPETLVINNVTPGRIAPSTLTIVSNNGLISTQGIVSDDATIERINTALEGKFGQKNVKDDMSSFHGSEAPVWIDGMLSMIDQLDGISNPILKVTGTDLVLAGTVVGEDIRRVKIATAERLLGAELTVINNLSIKPADSVKDEPASIEVVSKPNTGNTASAANKRPPSIEFLSDNNKLTLSGSLANEEQATSLRDGLSNLFGADAFTDTLTIDTSVESANWIEEALSVTSEIRSVNDFGLNVNSGQMLLSGSVTDRDMGRNLSIAATEIAGSKLDILNTFSVSKAIDNSEEDLLAESLMQELNALRTRNIVFNKNSTTLTDSARDVLDDVAAAILGYDDLVVEIAGHTDSSGDAVRNLKLSKERATAVRNYLVEQNVPGSRLSPIGYGETTPISDNETGSGRAANRRIEFNL